MDRIDDISHYNSLSQIFDFIMKKGFESKLEKWNKKQPLMQLFRDNFKNAVSKIIIDNNLGNYEVTSRSGYCGRWTRVPFCVILNKKYNGILDKCYATKGMYPGYLVSEDCKEIYLVYMIGTSSKYDRTIIRTVKSIREIIDTKNYQTYTPVMSLGKDPHKYRLGTVFFKTYTEDNISDNSMLERDLIDFIEFHNEKGDKIYEIVKNSIC